MTSGISDRRAPRHLTQGVALRERAHRRWLALGVAALLALGILPIMADHGPQRIETALTGLDHIGTLCLSALHVLLTPVHGGFHLLLEAGVLYALWDRFRAWRHLTRALAALDTRLPEPADAFGLACRRVGIPLRMVRVVEGLPNPAFTAGMLMPRVYVAAELSARVSGPELEAILAHEAAHAARRDPLRSSLLRALACALFWIPVLSRLVEDLRDEAEIVADDRAAARTEAIILASAIVNLAQWGDAPLAPAGAVGFHSRELLDRRVRRLLGEDARIASHVTRASVVAAGLALLIVSGSGVLMAHPLPGNATIAGAEVHCAHHADGPLSHLFCRRGTASHADCPHTTAAVDATAPHH